MRHFTLVNSGGKVLDITTKEVLFHDISGLGFNEDNDFRHIGEVWWLNHTSFNQATITGKILFNESDTIDPYTRYRSFVTFISKQPLTLLYNPKGPIEATILGDDKDDPDTYYRIVRVSKLDKSEKNEYGVIDESIDFIAYTPWYKKEIVKIEPPESDGSEDSGWIWGGPTGSDLYSDAVDGGVISFPQDYGEFDPVVFEPEGVTLTAPDYSSSDSAATITVNVPAYDGSCIPAKFKYEAIGELSLSLKSAVKSPVKLTIYGPLVKPMWTHSVLNRDNLPVVVGTGAFTSTVTLSSSNEYLVIDNTDGQYRIVKHNENGTETDLYDQRRFDLPCFITLREGENQISVTGSVGDLAVAADNVHVEGHLYYATV